MWTYFLENLYSLQDISLGFLNQTQTFLKMASEMSNDIKVKLDVI